MGASPSQPSPPAASTSHVWTSTTPVSFSEDVVNSLQSSSETDSTRARTLELHIQSRVAAELAALRERADKDFTTLAQTLSSSDAASGSKSPSASDKLRDLGRESVQNEVQELRRKLEGRKQMKEVDAAVETAKEDLVRCLRGNDRRPLDCWKEVEGFKEEVRRLESAWVEKVVR